MPSDLYASVGGGLKLKGAKVGKPKKKKKEKTDLEKNLSGGESSTAVTKRNPATEDENNETKKDGDERIEDTEEREEESGSRKTEAERRFEERKRKKLLDMSGKSGRPELMKTHKERVEELNTYLSKLSEHHDMPKIGPG
ncbi:hypothetical protein ACHAQH_006727 [Verticillium albo-atrum]